MRRTAGRYATSRRADTAALLAAWPAALIAQLLMIITESAVTADRKAPAALTSQVARCRRWTSRQATSRRMVVRLAAASSATA